MVSEWSAESRGTVDNEEDVEVAEPHGDNGCLPSPQMFVGEWASQGIKVNLWAEEKLE